MRTFKAIIFAATAVALSPAAALAAPTGQAPFRAANNEAREEKKICKHLDTTGTRMAKRACHTREEWKKIEKLQD